MFPVRDQRRDDCGGTFRVTIFDHDPAEDFGGVDPFHPFPRALELVRGESPVRVLQRQEHVDGILQTVLGD
jgi:hypothetical protein